MCRFIIILFVTPILAISSYAQGNGLQAFISDQNPEQTNFLVRSWQAADGLPVNSTTDIIQSSEGYLWITSYDGLIRFDGVHFNVFNKSNTREIISNRFFYAQKDQNGGLWFTLEFGGILRYYDQEFTYFDSENGFSNHVVSSKPISTPDGNFYIPTREGIYVFKDEEFQKINLQTASDQNYIRTINAIGNSIIAGTNSGLIVIENGRFVQMYHHPENPDYNEVEHIAVGPGDQIYAASSNRFLRVNPDGELEPIELDDRLDGYEVDALYGDSRVVVKATRNGILINKSNLDDRFHNLSEIGNSAVQKIYRDASDQLWFITNAGRLYLYQGDAFYQIAANIDAGFLNFFEDGDLNLWLTSRRGGLNRIYKPSVFTLHSGNGIGADNILGVYEDSRGRIWAGSMGQGVSKIDPNGEVSVFNTAAGIPGNIVYSIGESPEREIWAGFFEHGLGRYIEDEERFEVYSLGETRTQNDIRALHFDGDGNIWAGTMGGLIKFDPETRQIRRVYSMDDGLPSNFIYSINEDYLGNLWLATAGGGLSYFDKESFSNFGTEQGLRTYFIRSIYIDRDDPDIVWLGTEGMGLARLKDGEITHLTADNGLYDNLLHFVHEDQKGNLWMSSNRGIFYITKTDAEAFLDGEEDVVNSVVFNEYDGMRSMEANGGFQYSGFFTSQNELLVPTQAGIAIVKTDTLPEAYDPPLPIVELIQAGEQSVKLPHALELESGANDLKIRFTGFDYSSPERIRFRYRLVGYDDDWIEAGNSREAVYTNLPPKKYVFEVMAANKLGNWNQEPAAVAVSIAPRFYQKPVFQVIFVLLFIAGLIGMYRFRVGSLKSKERYLTNEVEKRTKDLLAEKEAAENQKKIIEQQARELREMNRTKDKFFSIIAHDLKGPFQSILGFTRLLDEQYQQLDDDELRSYLKLVNQSSENVFKLLQNLLSWASLQNKNVKPVLEAVDAEAAVYRALKIMTPSASEKGIDIITECEKHLTIKADVNMLDTILRNLTSNAVKFSFPRGIVKLRTSVRDDMACVEVIDNGTGMSREDLENLFRIDSHFTRKGTANESGTGLGLVLCKELVEIMGGILEVNSEDGEGTTFFIYLPLSDEKPVQRSPFIKSIKMDSGTD